MIGTCITVRMRIYQYIRIFKYIYIYTYISREYVHVVCIDTHIFAYKYDQVYVVSHNCSFYRSTHL